MHADHDVHQHFNDAPQTGKTRRITCIHCNWGHAKHTTTQRRHLVTCQKYHDWAAANNQPLVAETPERRAGRPSAAFDDWPNSPGGPIGGLRLPNHLRPADGGILGDESIDPDADADPEEEHRPPLGASIKRQIDKHLAAGIFKGGHAFDLFESNPEFRAMFHLLGYSPPTKELIRTRHLDDFYKTLKARG